LPCSAGCQACMQADSLRYISLQKVTVTLQGDRHRCLVTAGSPPTRSSPRPRAAGRSP
jgi:hypothetical protein